ncbi:MULTISPECIES: FkbM family methyltransferase [unclassified Ruegeria]|uniref:FkbM family methyltransferase n=1 Tax=unclassified Ruegeria TaxID=2625375 RepID=UPI001C2B7B65|nr:MULTISPECIES: FkbM family methyltransferase [unclassified Ruegeria]
MSNIAQAFGYRLVKGEEETPTDPVASTDPVVENIEPEVTTEPDTPVVEQDWTSYADPETLGKGELFDERARDVTSDPLNLLIDRVPQAGYVDTEGNVILHNGNRVAVSGEYSYYGEFSDVLITNRGVHEPLEEYCFQQVLKRLRSTAPKMLELGAYWAHYSMWLKLVYPQADCTMVEPEEQNIEAGKRNFELNGFDGTFIQSFVSKDQFSVDAFMKETGCERLDILHSDIQGYEVEMLENAQTTLSEKRADFVFVSTHSDALHDTVIASLKSVGYRIEASSSFEDHSTSFDGFVLASSPEVPALFKSFRPWGRHEIAAASGVEILEKLSVDLAATTQAE